MTGISRRSASSTRAPRAWISLANRHPCRKPRAEKLRAALGRFAPDFRRRFGRGEVGVVFVDDRTIADLAGRFRGSPRPTDVLSFRYDECGPGKGELLGEIIVSLDTAGRQAEERGVPLSHELSLLCVHGLLHLCGVDDERPVDWRRMRRLEFEAMMKLL